MHAAGLATRPSPYNEGILRAFFPVLLLNPPTIPDPFTHRNRTPRSDADLRERDSAAAQATIAAAGTQKKMTVRNLRVREDTAKYLHNLDVSSAYYDPKTRSMRENPFADRAAGDVPAGVVYRGDAELKASGGAQDFLNDQLFAWEADAAGSADGVGMQAMPTQLAMLKKEFEERKAALASVKAERLKAQYGEAAGVEAIPIELRRGASRGGRCVAL